LQIYQICTNPSNTGIVSNFTIATFSANAAIERLTSGITVQMINPANFYYVYVERFSQMNADLTSYKFRIRQQA
jgi:hypothetical protein